MFDVAVVKDAGPGIQIGRGIGYHDSFLAALRLCREYTRDIAGRGARIAVYVGTKNGDRNNTWRIDCIADKGKLVFWVTEKNEWD